MRLSPEAFARATPSPPRLSPEWRLLACCARPALDETGREALRRLLQGRIDWRSIERLAARHRLEPLLFHHLATVASLVPAPVMQSLRDRAASNLRHGLRLTNELLSLLHALEAAGILAVPYKGPALAAQLYGDPARRQYQDLDIVVAPEHFRAAREMALARGYRRSHPVPESAEAYVMGARYCERLEHPAGFVLEIHWRFASREVHFGTGLAELAAPLRLVPIGDASVHGFGDVDLLFILCAHGARHRWSRLEWIAGTAAVCDRLDARAWDGVLQRAAQLRCERMVLLGAALAASVLGANVPPRVLERAARTRAMAPLVREVWHRLGDEAERVSAGASSWARDLFFMRLHDRRADGLRYLWRRVADIGIPTDGAGDRLPKPALALLTFAQLVRKARKAPSVFRWLASRG